MSECIEVAKGDLELLAPWMEADFSEQLVTAVVCGNAANTEFVGTGAIRFILKHERLGVFCDGLITPYLCLPSPHSSPLLSLWKTTAICLFVHERAARS